MLNLDDLQSVEYPDMSWRRTGEDNPSNLQNVLPDLLPQTSFHAHGPLESLPVPKLQLKYFQNQQSYPLCMYQVRSRQAFCRGPRFQAYRMSWFQVYKMGGGGGGGGGGGLAWLARKHW